MLRSFFNTLRLIPYSLSRLSFFTTLRLIPYSLSRLSFFTTLRLIPYTLALIPFFSSCENDIRTIKLLTSPDKLPVETEKDVELLYSDSAKLKLRLKAPEMNRYEGSPNYLELPKGVLLIFYDDSLHMKSQITANYAKRNLDDGSMEARNNVVVVNERNDKLFTEHLIYEEKVSGDKPQIHTDANVTIITADDTLYGKGLESNRDFTKYKILKPEIRHTVRDSTEEK